MKKAILLIAALSFAQSVLATAATQIIGAEAAATYAVLNDTKFKQRLNDMMQFDCNPGISSIALREGWVSSTPSVELVMQVNCASGYPIGTITALYMADARSVCVDCDSGFSVRRPQ